MRPPWSDTYNLTDRYALKKKLSYDKSCISPHDTDDDFNDEIPMLGARFQMKSSMMALSSNTNDDLNSGDDFQKPAAQCQKKSYKFRKRIDTDSDPEREIE